MKLTEALLTLMSTAVCRPLQRPEKTEGVPRSKKGLGAGGSNEPNVTKAFKIVGFQ